MTDTRVTSLPACSHQYHSFVIRKFFVGGWGCLLFFDSPFMVLAVEETVEYVTERADMVEVVQDDHSGELCVRLLRVTLFCQVGQVLTQILRREALRFSVCTHTDLDATFGI